MEQQEQQEQDEYHGNVGVIPPRMNDREESPEIGVIRELSPKKVKERIRMELKGYDWDYEDKKYVKREGFIPMINDLGIQKFLNALPALSDTVTFSNYNVEQIQKMVQFSMESVIPSIYVNYKEYGIKSKCDLPVLTNMLFTLTYASYQKAMGAGDRGVIGRTTSENIISRSGEMQMPQPQNERKGIFSNPFSRR